MNEQLYNDIILKEETLPYYVHCHTYGHHTLDCPTRSKPDQPFVPSHHVQLLPRPTPLAQPPTLHFHPALSTQDLTDLEMLQIF